MLRIGITKDTAFFQCFFFKDNYLFKLYLKELRRMSEPSYLDNLFNEIDQELKKKLDIIYSEYPYFNFIKKTFYIKQLYIKKVLSLPVSIHAYFRRYYKKDEQKIIELDIGNIRSIPIEIISLSLSSGVSFPSKIKERVIQPSLPEQTMNIEKVRFVLPRNFKWKQEYVNELTVNYSHMGIKNTEQRKGCSLAVF